MTPLGEKIAALIAANGPITIADYMALCLGDREHGYYMVREPFGGSGDFITAPEVSQIFGELIGLWAVATWQAMGSPSPFVLVELGPGRGTLMADLLRAARLRPAFLDAARIHLVETSPRLRAIQEATLAGAAVTWHAAIDALPAGPAIVVANEFFDALPIRQYVATASGWAERMVGLDEAGRLRFGMRDSAGPSSTVPTHAKPSARMGKPTPSGEGDTPYGAGGIVEISPAATAIMSTLATRIASDGGAALIIDYGYEGPAFGETLQAVRGHRHVDPLAEPGEADLTAHVDFAALARAAAEAGARPRCHGADLQGAGRVAFRPCASRLRW
ncbi:MAG TPA: SAM-dependent methyltransferase, partial [Bauldia sp.]|nr:SAM-dependent methyltransferase [Bauldia sp.]